MNNTKQKRLNIVTNLYKIYKFRKDTLEIVETIKGFNLPIKVDAEHYYFRVNVETGILNHAYTCEITQDIKNCVEAIKANIEQERVSKQWLNHLFNSKFRKETDESPIQDSKAMLDWLTDCIAEDIFDLNQYLTEERKIIAEKKLQALKERNLRPKRSYIIKKLNKIEKLEKKYDIVIGKNQAERVSNTKPGETFLRKLQESSQVNS